jgi:hypothetical protein
MPVPERNAALRGRLGSLRRRSRSARAAIPRGRRQSELACRASRYPRRLSLTAWISGRNRKSPRLRASDVTVGLDAEADLRGTDLPSL